LAHHKEPEIRDVLQLPKNYFLFVGRILPRKGIETLLEAYKQYRETAKEEVWDLVIVGAGDHLNSLRTQFSGVSGLHYAGAQFGDELCKYYGLARVLIVPSDSDPWGLVVNEAMASGLPVIVSSGCGAGKTLVRDAENGWIFKSGNVDQLKSLMYRITLLSPETLNKMGKKSHEIIAQWTLDRFADGVLSAVNIKKRPQAGLISDVLTKLWKGRMQVT
jgi:1,2-diacylglycerol 3-alpha-glucosyltransferase